MKMKLTLTLLAFAAVSLNLHAATSALPAPLPEFMNDAQAAKWSADQAATAQTTSAQEPSTQFYTGKPYVADAGGYVYKYRTYNPEMSRWTSTDPSGFPDGPNNFTYAKNEVSYALDNNGLDTITVNGVSVTVNIPNGSASISVEIPGTKTKNNTGSSETVAYSISGTTTIHATILGTGVDGGGTVSASPTITVKDQYFADVSIVASVSGTGITWYTQTNTWE